MTQLDRDNFRQECQRRRDAGFVVRGDTYPIKDQLKRLGGIWDGWAQAWLMPDEHSFATGLSLVADQATQQAAQARAGIAPPPARPVTRGRRGLRKPRPTPAPVAPSNDRVLASASVQGWRHTTPTEEPKAPPRRRFGRLAAEE